uniref:ATP-dependent DNA helicase RecG n=1 Tax=Tetraselmis sp. GSL018 TaxID=582737 RepID=A0A061S458_9CHLO
MDKANVALAGTVLSSSVYRPRPNLAMLKMTLSVRQGLYNGDGGMNHTVHVTRFMQGSFALPALSKIAATVPVGSVAIVEGKLDFIPKDGSWEMKSPKIMSMEERGRPADALGGEGDEELRPVYSAVRLLTNKDLQKIMPRALEAIAESRCAEEPLPADTVQRLKLMPWMDAIRAIHFPEGPEELEHARQRMAFQELLMLQLGLLLRRRSSVESSGDSEEELRLTDDAVAAANFATESLPWQLTAGQAEAISEILRDMRQNKPMLRLLQGDVGSGKTAVALLAMLAATASGWQAALMAPTEVLAAQHKDSIDRLISSFKGKAPEGLSMPRVSLLTGSTRTAPRRATLEGLKDGSIGIVIGTHSLISRGVEFSKLGLAVIDEQHRFGVRQRSALQRASSPPPHVLTLSATPIPRTLALVAYGEMDISTISDRPPGRIGVHTRVLRASDKSRDEAYSAIRRELRDGYRSYVICPLVDGGEDADSEGVKAAEQEYKRLSEGGYLGGAKCGLLHGRLSGEQKSRALQDFAEGRTQVLITTTVVEVGVDVPEASVMVIEHAERFGLAQLHQLRGRIGRGTRPSECILLVAGGEESLSRVRVLENSTDGFKIAEADLEQRGPGQLLGTRQSGAKDLAALQVTRLPHDNDLLLSARAEAARLLGAGSVDGEGNGDGERSVPTKKISMRLWAAYNAAAPPELDLNSEDESLVDSFSGSSEFK